MTKLSENFIKRFEKKFGLFGFLQGSEFLLGRFLAEEVDSIKKGLLDVADAGEFEDMRREVNKFFDE